MLDFEKGLAAILVEYFNLRDGKKANRSVDVQLESESEPD